MDKMMLMNFVALILFTIFCTLLIIFAILVISTRDIKSNKARFTVMTLTEWNKSNPVLKRNEIGIEISKNMLNSAYLIAMKIGDGEHKWDQLPYALIENTTERKIYKGGTL